MKKISKLFLITITPLTTLSLISCRSKYSLWDEIAWNERNDYLNRIQKKVKELYKEKELKIAEKMFDEHIKKIKLQEKSDKEIKKQKQEAPWKFDDNELSDFLIMKKYYHYSEIAKQEWEKKWKDTEIALTQIVNGINIKLKEAYLELNKILKYNKKSNVKDTLEIYHFLKERAIEKITKWEKEAKYWNQVKKTFFNNKPSFNNITYLHENFDFGDTD